MKRDGETRWERLERYSRWKQPRLRLDRLPNDVLLNMFPFLDHRDLCALLHALYAAPRENIRHLREVHLVPDELRLEWLHGAAYDALHRTLHSMGEVALYHARNCSHVSAHVNWSVFTGPLLPSPICVYEWTPRQTASVVMNERELWRVVRDAGDVGRTAVCIALYRYCRRGNTWIIHPDPCYRAIHVVFPHFLVSESCRGRRRCRVDVAPPRLGDPVAPRLESRAER